MRKTPRETTKRFVRERIRDPKEFQKGSFRTIDPGRPGHTKLIIGKPKGKKTTRIQAILRERKPVSVRNSGGKKMVKPHKFQYASEWKAGSGQRHEGQYRRERNAPAFVSPNKRKGWFGQSHRHREAAIRGHRLRRR